MCHTSNCREQTLSILNYSDQVTVMKYFEFQSYDAEFHNGHIIFLHWLIGRLVTDRHSGYRRYRWPFQRPIKHWWKDTVCSPLAMHRGHNRAPFNSCVCQSECACMLVRQNRGGGLSEKVKGGCCFPSVWYYQRAGPCIPQVNTRQQSLDDTMQRFGFVPKAASRPRAQTVTFSLKHWQKDSLKKKKRHYENVLKSEIEDVWDEQKAKK